LFFLLSKTLGIMLLPTNFPIGVGLFGAILLERRFASLGRKFLIEYAGFRRSENGCSIRWSRDFRQGMPREVRLMVSSSSADR
jgi:hypothetical protein